LPDNRHRFPRRVACVRHCVLLFDSRLQDAEASPSRPHWLLALALPFSRSDRAHTRGCRCQVLRAHKEVDRSTLRFTRPCWLRSCSERSTSGKVTVPAGNRVVNALGAQCLHTGPSGPVQGVRMTSRTG